VYLFGLFQSNGNFLSIQWVNCTTDLVSSASVYFSDVVQSVDRALYNPLNGLIYLAASNSATNYIFFFSPTNNSCVGQVIFPDKTTGFDVDGSTGKVYVSYGSKLAVIDINFEVTTFFSGLSTTSSFVLFNFGTRLLCAQGSIFFENGTLKSAGMFPTDSSVVAFHPITFSTFLVSQQGSNYYSFSIINDDFSDFITLNSSIFPSNTGPASLNFIMFNNRFYVQNCVDSNILQFTVIAP